MTIGRNDLCPCGSGKKYKRCCGPGQNVVSLEAVRVDSTFGDLWDKLGKFLAGRASGDDVADGFLRFFVTTPDEADKETGLLAMDWVAFAYRTADGSTFAERLAAAGKGLSDQEREMLRAWAASAPGFFRVDAADGADLSLSRLPDGQAFPVRAPGSKLAPGDLCHAWLLPVHSTHRFGYLVQDIDPDALPPLMHLVEVEMELFRRQRPAATWAELYREHWPRLTDAFTLAAVDGESVLRIAAPPGPSVLSDGTVPPGADPKWVEVGRLIEQAVARDEDWFEPQDTQGLLRLWWDGALTLRPRTGRPEGWAAAVLYLYLRDVLGDMVTQADVGEMLGVSAGTVGSRSRELAAVLQLQPMDPRYVDLMEPLVREYWRTTCLGAIYEGGMPGGLESHLLGEMPKSAEQAANVLLEQAWEETGPERTRLAKMALDVWPDAADGYVLLGSDAEAQGKLQAARRFYEMGVQAGERALGADFFEECAGHFYGLLESRPYMRSRAGLAACLWALGEQQAALAHYEEMLRLNPMDNQGIRYRLAAHYLELGEDWKLGRHLDQYADEPTAAIAFTRALWRYRMSGPDRAADGLLAAAQTGNPHVAAYLLGRKRLPPEPPAHIDFGGDLEAISYAYEFGEGWKKTAGALDWLRTRLKQG